MKKETRNIFKISGIYLTAIIGAGFASGQEIIQFFTKYGRGGFYGIILSGLLFAISGFMVLDRVYTDSIEGFEELIFPLTGPVIGGIIETIAVLFLFSVYSVMIAGMGKTFSDLTRIPFLCSVFLASFISMVIIVVGVEGVARLSSLLAPILLIGILGAGIFVIIFSNKETLNQLKIKFTKFTVIKEIFCKGTNNWFVSALLYVSYNNILSTSVLSNLLPYLKTKRTAVMGGFLGGSLLCLSALILNIALTPYSLKFGEFVGEFPLIDIIGWHSNWLKSAYYVILIFAMLTSAVASGHSVICRISKRLSIKERTATILVCTAAIPLSNLGFSGLISHIYPLFGYTGLFILITFLIHWLKKQ